jgi:putative DNA primase/helicase
MTQKYGHGLVIADNDKSGTGQRIAKESMLPFWISDVEGEDGNDYHRRMGLFRFSQGLASKLIVSREISIA